MDVADVVGRVLAPALAQEVDEGLVLEDGGLLPLLDEPFRPGEIVETLLEVVDQLDQAVVAAEVEERIVEGQVPFVVEVEIVGRDRLLHAGVQLLHGLDVGGP